VDGFKRAMIRALSEAFAERALASKFAALFTTGTARSVADARFTAAMSTYGLGRVSGAANGGLADASTSFGGAAATGGMSTALGGAALVAGAGVAGYNTGSALYNPKFGKAGNMVRGGLAGAATGAAIGAAIGSVVPVIGTAVGAVVGAVVGFTAALFGVASAAKASAAQVREMRKALDATMESLRASVSGDTLASRKAQVHAESAAIRKQIEEAYATGDKNSANVRERNKLLAEANKLEAERLRQLEQEIAVLQRRTIEDYNARAAAATPGNEKAEALADFDRKQQREREDLVMSFGSVIDEFEAARLKALDSALAAEKLAFATEGAANALDGLTTSVRNAPSGFKIERYTYANAVPKSVSGLDNVPSAFSPPSVPFTRPTQASSSIGSVHVTLPNVTNAKQFVEELDKIRLQTVGMNGTRAQALERM
jgi:gas vesicle protein